MDFNVAELVVVAVVAAFWVGVTLFVARRLKKGRQA